MFQRLKSIFAPKAPVDFRHPKFGILTLDSGLWTGEALHEGRKIHFCIGGTETEPDAGLLNRVSELVGTFPEVERRALDFLRAQESSAAQGAFEFYSLDFLWENKPHLYVLEFTLAGDDDGIWRVEFENDQPTVVGRDD